MQCLRVLSRCFATPSPSAVSVGGTARNSAVPRRYRNSGRTRAMAWNDERVDLLKKMWYDGLSASQIAGRLGGVTRNAVIGKVHRLGLSGRATTSRMKSHRPRARTQSPRRLMKPRFANIGTPALRQLYLGDTEPYTPPAEELVIPLNERKSIQTLTEACCRWPIGDPQLQDFHFCGRK